MVIADCLDWSAELAEATAEVGSAAVELADDGGEVSCRWVPGIGDRHGNNHYRAPEGSGAIVGTSGTTGAPTLVPIPWAHMERFVPAAGRPEVTPRRTVIVALPLTSITGLNIIGPCLARPHRVTLMERVDVHRWADLVSSYQPRSAGLPPAAMQTMLDTGVPKAKLSSLEYWVTGSAPLEPDLAERFEDHYGIPVLVSYGATELGGTVASWSVEDRRALSRAKRGSCGRPRPAVRAAVADVETGRPLPPNEQGVLEVRGLAVPLSAAHDGWLRTSDLARLDSDGWLYIDGRTDDVIIRGGFKVPLPEVEKALLTFPGVTRAAAVGYEDARTRSGSGCPRWSLSSAAPATSEEDLVAWVRERLAPYKVPVRVVIMPVLP